MKFPEIWILKPFEKGVAGSQWHWGVVGVWLGRYFLASVLIQ